jgi:plastocyanin
MAVINDHRPFTVNVIERCADTKMNQHLVSISSNGSAFHANPAELQVEAGDLVLWNLQGERTVPCAIVGDKGFFNSARLANESGYSHAFGFAGEYRWCDAYGSGVGGVVRVRDPGCKNERDYEHWRELLAQGTVVMIHDGKADPAEVEIVIGQRVFFSVVQAPGISITDGRLLDRSQAAKTKR